MSNLTVIAENEDAANLFDYFVSYRKRSMKAEHAEVDTVSIEALPLSDLEIAPVQVRAH